MHATVGAAAALYMQFQPSTVMADTTPSGGKLKKTLSNAGLWPEPEKTGSKLQRRHTGGDMSVFTQGQSAEATVSDPSGGKMA